MDAILDLILDELSKPDQGDWCAVELDVIEEIDVDDLFSESTNPFLHKSPFAETTVPVDMPWLRAQLW